MFIPFVFTLDPSDDLIYLWYFYKSLDMAKRCNAPIIAQQKYFVDPEVYARSGRAEARDAIWGEVNEYDMPTLSDMKLIQQFHISKDLEKQLITVAGSQTGAWIRILRERWDLLEKYLANVLDNITKQNREKIEGILVLGTHIPSLQKVAEARDIKVIYLEWGPMRQPIYRKTAYLDRIGLNREGELSERYDAFKINEKVSPVSFLTRKEILSLFLATDQLQYLELIDSEPMYELGIAAGAVLDYSNIVYSSFISDFDVLITAQQNFSDSSILVREHPRLQSTFKITQEMTDHSSSSMHFICKCKRIACIHSNVAFETMLLNRTAYTLGQSPYRFKSLTDLSVISDAVVELEFVNFVVFSYLVPYELLFDSEYLRWRMKNPSEIEIYTHNLEYYLGCYGMENNILQEQGSKRLNTILTAREFVTDNNLQGIETPSNGWEKYFTFPEKTFTNHKRIQILMSNYKNLKIEYEKSNEIADLLTAQNIDNKNELLLLRKDHVDLENYTKNLENELLLLRKDHVDLENYTKNLENELLLLRKDHVDLENYTKDIENELRLLQKYHGVLEVEYEKQKISYDEERVEKIQLMTEHEILKESYSALMQSYDELRNEKDILKMQLKDREEELLTNKRAIEAVLKSSSWKITRPLRCMKLFIKH